MHNLLQAPFFANLSLVLFGIVSRNSGADLPLQWGRRVGFGSAHAASLGAVVLLDLERSWLEHKLPGFLLSVDAVSGSTSSGHRDRSGPSSDRAVFAGKLFTPSDCESSPILRRRDGWTLLQTENAHIVANSGGRMHRGRSLCSLASDCSPQRRHGTAISMADLLSYGNKELSAMDGQSG